jgi:hypothetical protein
MSRSISCPPKYEYETPPIYTESLESLPSYDQLFAPDLEKAIETVKKTGYIILDDLTPEAIMEYFILHGAQSYKDLYLLSVVNYANSSKYVSFNGIRQVHSAASLPCESFKREPSNNDGGSTFYLVNRSVIVTMSSLPSLSNIQYNVCFRHLNVHNASAVSTNVLEMKINEQKKFIRHLRSGRN